VYHQVRFEHRESVPLAVIRRQVHQSQLPRVVPEGCGKVWTVLKQNGVSGAGRHVAVYRNETIDLEVGVEIVDGFSGVAEVVRSATPAGMAEAVTHLGPYGGLHEAHGAVRDWCASHGYELAGPNWEIYGHWKPEWDGDPSQITTEVVYLVLDAGAHEGPEEA